MLERQTESLLAFDLLSEAKMAIEDIYSRGKLANIAGGIICLLEGYHLGEIMSSALSIMEPIQMRS